MKLYISNAFSFSMLDPDVQGQIEGARVPYRVKDPIQTLKRWQHIAQEQGYSGRLISCVGHPDTAALFSILLNQDIDCDRDPRTVQLKGSHQDSDADRLLVGQVMHQDGLPEGATQLSDEAIIVWWTI